VNRLFFADLGGSETLSKSMAAAEVMAPVLVVGGEEVSRISWAEFYNRRKRLEETLNINRGLFALKTVVDALHAREDVKKENGPDATLPYVPYQNSKLTMLLQDGLGGRAKTSVVVCVSQDPAHAVESCQTLRFGERCAHVTGQTEVTEISLQKALNSLDETISELEKLIAAKERWEDRRVKRTDARHGADIVMLREELIAEGKHEEAARITDEAMTGEEEIVTSILVGAETERAQLEKLLRQRREIFGEEREVSTQGWSAEDHSWHHADQTQVLLPREKKLEKRFTKKALCNTEMVADALEFIFRKTPAARSEGLDTNAYVDLTKMLVDELNEDTQGTLKDWCVEDLETRDKRLRHVLARREVQFIEDPDVI